MKVIMGFPLDFTLKRNVLKMPKGAIFLNIVKIREPKLYAVVETSAPEELRTLLLIASFEEIKEDDDRLIYIDDFEAGSQRLFVFEVI